MNKEVRLSNEELHNLICNKVKSAGLQESHAEELAKHLVYADRHGIHSHGAVRVDYYSERIAKGGINAHPTFDFEKTGESTGIFHGDNGMGHVVANEALKEAITMAKSSGMAAVGVSRTSHTGTMAYYVKKAAEQDLVAISMCQSDPMVVPFGGAEPYYGTNPIGFGAPRKGAEPVVFDMATTVQAWGKVLDARSKNEPIPDNWAVDESGEPTTDPHMVRGLLPISGPKGYGLMMMVDILSGILLGLPFGKDVSSMYNDLSVGRDLGQLFILIDPARFTDIELFKEQVDQSMNELNHIKPASGFDRVMYPGELALVKAEEYEENGIPVVADIHAYLTSATVHFDKYALSSPFAD
ncbi:ureidoglycolate dehydrogenase [Alkalibacterium sp.]|nr:MAG: ureidoglycolate dehydrogenase [Alkalibacterium sp.]